MAPPDLTYTTRVDITLGGKRVEVIPIPTDHAPDNTVVRFVDGTNVTLPSELAKIRQVEATDFEHFVCSHGRLGTKADVSANLRSGQPLEQTRDSVLLSDYSSWEFYEQQRPQNVTGAYRLLSAARSPAD